MLPSPTAAATRFTGADRTSPHAKIPGTLVSRRLQHVAGLEMDLTGLGVDSGDRSRHEDLGPEPPRLLQRSTRQLVARHTGREAQVVLDPRRRPGLAARCLALDHEHPQPFRCPVHGRRQAGPAPRG